jgi:hypothetical protein
VLTAIAVAATLLVLPVLAFAGHFSLVALPGIALAAALVAAGRDTAHPMAALLIVALLWLVSGPNEITPWSVGLATLMLIVHSAVALRSSLPPGAAVSSVLLRRWLARGVFVVAVTTLVYLVGVAVHDLDRGDNQVLMVLALALLGALVLLLRNETVHEERP